MTAKVVNKKPISYYYWPIGIICFFLVIAGFNSFLAYKAFTKRPQATETSPYEAGQIYDQTLAKLALAKTLGLKNIFNLSISKDSKLLITYKFPDSLNIKEVQSAKLSIVRPNNSLLNSEIELSKNLEENILYGYANSTKAGLWLLELKIKLEKGTALVKSSNFVKAAST